MKREFLANLKVNGEALTKEVIDAILDENSRDIGAAKKPYEDYDHIKEQLTTAQQTLADIQKNGQTVEAAQQKATEWENKYNQAVADHQKELADRDFAQKLEGAITGAKGKNAKAITALLDLKALQDSKNQDADIKAALEELKKGNDYLFESDNPPPPYAPNPGISNPTPAATGSLADALRERFNK